MARNHYSKKNYHSKTSWADQRYERLVRNPEPLSLKELTPDGYVYILTNKFVPNVYKIGFTKRESSIRAKEISRDTGVPGEWVVACDWHVGNAYETEQSIFLKFAKYRIDRSELFDFGGLGIEEVVNTIDEKISRERKELEEYAAKLNADKIAYQDRKLSEKIAHENNVQLEKVEYENRAQLDETIREEAILRVEEALKYVNTDIHYVPQIRAIIGKFYRDDSSIYSEAIDNENSSLEKYMYAQFFLSVFLVILASFFKEEGLVGIIIFISVPIIVYYIHCIRNNEKELKEVIDINSQYYIENLPKDLESLKPIMAWLNIDRKIYVDGLEVTIKVDYSASKDLNKKKISSDVNQQHITLETFYNGRKYYEKYINTEKNALIQFIITVKR